MRTRQPNRSSRCACRCTAAIASLALLCAQAPAQPVQKCLIDGRIVFQASPCPPEPRARAAAPQAVAAEASGPAKKKTLADLLRERDAADRTPPTSPEPQSDGAKVLGARMGAL